MQFLGQENGRTRPLFVGLTNFSVISRRSRGSWISSRENSFEDYVAKILDPSRLELRCKFLQIGLRHIAGQTTPVTAESFRLILNYSAMLPKTYKQWLAGLASEFDWLLLGERNPDGWLGWSDSVVSCVSALAESSGRTGVLPYLSFRLDDDDFLSIHYVQNATPYVTIDNIGRFLSFPNGFQVLWGEDKSKPMAAKRWRWPCGSVGLGAICGWDADKKQCVSSYPSVFTGTNHATLVQDGYDVIFDESPDMFVYSRHDDQDTNVASAVELDDFADSGLGDFCKSNGFLF